MLGYAPLLRQVRIVSPSLGNSMLGAHLGQTLSPEEQDAYYRKLAQYMASASDIQKFDSDHPKESKAFGLDLTARQIGAMVGGFSSLKWGGIAGALRTGSATAYEAKSVDDLGALIVPAEKKLTEAQKVVASKPDASDVPIWKWALAGGAVIGLAFIFRKHLAILNL